MEIVQIKGQKFRMGGKVRGAVSCKWNRATKLANRYEELDEKFRGIVERGYKTNSDHSRCALAMLVMMQTGMRVGNESSAEGYITKPHPNQKGKEPEFVQTYGLTTMQRHHLVIQNGVLKINFIGKKQIENNFEINDKFIVEQVSRLMEGESNSLVFNISAFELTRFIKKYVGDCFSPKDFRTMKANLIAYEFSTQFKKVTTKKAFNQYLKDLYNYVSTQLNNTPAVCRRSYVCDKLELHLQDKLFKTVAA